jgi:hypothetical protein
MQAHANLNFYSRNRRSGSAAIDDSEESGIGNMLCLFLFCDHNRPLLSIAG